MKTDQFVELLSGDTALPRTLQSVLTLAGAGGAAIAAALFFAVIGFRPDIAEAFGSPRFLFKFVITLWLAVTACVAAARLGRPDGQMARKAFPLVKTGWVSGVFATEQFQKKRPQRWAGAEDELCRRVKRP
ncbi:DUF1109 family protein [Bradyrhizobium sp. Pear77]|uniref:NrsF family protein n=1 Tax=Bradyrhizobium altum TaxID=1571202 RepID=UPI001E2F2F15|nr:NrsF family protein [Bradyrhizobium altum]MCC8953375.1 DUF1109 family protein [Bradyrhizobium altum]